MHIDDKELNKFQNGMMDSKDMIAFLEHLDNCNFCLDQIIQQEEPSTIAAPAYLKEQILKKASSPEVQVVKTAAETSRKVQLFYYSLQTAAGILAALFLLFSVGSIDFSANIQRQNPLYDFTKEIEQEITNNTSAVTDYLNDISNKLLNGGK